MDHEILTLIPASLFAVLLVTAATYDFLQRRIPNWTVAGLILLFIAGAVLKMTPATWTSSLLAFCLAIAGSGALYLMGWLGAGDSKLFAASALYLGFSHLLLFLVTTALAGGIYALVVLLMRPKQVMRGMTARGREDGKRRGIPYGVAIAAGALATTFLSYDLQPRLGGLQPPARPAATVTAG